MEAPSMVTLFAPERIDGASDHTRLHHSPAAVHLPAPLVGAVRCVLFPSRFILCGICCQRYACTNGLWMCENACMACVPRRGAIPRAHATTSAAARTICRCVCLIVAGEERGLLPWPDSRRSADHPGQQCAPGHADCLTSPAGCARDDAQRDNPLRDPSSSLAGAASRDRPLRGGPEAGQSDALRTCACCGAMGLACCIPSRTAAWR